MSYIQDTLLKDENLRYQARLHWILFIRSLLLLFFATIIIIIVDPLVYKFVIPFLSLFFIITFID